MASGADLKQRFEREVSRRPPLGDVDDDPPYPTALGLAFEGDTQIGDLVPRVDRHLR